MVKTRGGGKGKMRKRRREIKTHPLWRGLRQGVSDTPHAPSVNSSPIEGKSFQERRTPKKERERGKGGRGVAQQPKNVDTTKKCFDMLPYMQI